MLWPASDHFHSGWSAVMYGSATGNTNLCRHLHQSSLTPSMFCPVSGRGPGAGPGAPGSSEGAAPSVSPDGAIHSSFCSREQRTRGHQLCVCFCADMENWQALYKICSSKEHLLISREKAALTSGCWCTVTFLSSECILNSKESKEANQRFYCFAGLLNVLFTTFKERGKIEVTASLLHCACWESNNTGRNFPLFHMIN